MATLLLVLFAVQPARADTVDDPAITPGYSASTVIGTNGGTETPSQNNVWTLSSVVQNSGSTSVSFLNNTGAAWTTIDIVAHYTDTAAHVYTCYPSPSSSGLPTGATNPFSVCPNPTTGNGLVTANTVTFNLSGGTGVANGGYFVFTYTNWNPSGPSVLSSFDFSANGGADPVGAVPEPASLLLLGSGLAGLMGLMRRKRL